MPIRYCVKLFTRAGIIYDRQGRSVLQDDVMYDPVVQAKSRLDSLNGATARLTTDEILHFYFHN